MDVETDDDIYRARLVYYGPPGYTLPVHLTYPQLLVGAGSIAGFGLVGWLLGFGWLALGFEVGAGILATAVIFKYVSPDRPARKVVATLIRDWRTATPPPAEPARLPRLSARHVRTGRKP